MSPDRRSRVEALFEGALARPREERQSWLEQVSGGDPELRAEAERLLAAHEQAAGILDRPVREIAARWIAESEPEPVPPERVGPYRVLHEIGRGGMGVVYQARHLRLGRLAALKFLPPHLASDHRARERFLGEARAASALDHPNICTIYDIGEAEDGRVFLAMAWYDGETLRDRLERVPLPAETAVDYAVQIARALAAAHEAGIVHRDLKPANLMITADGRVKLLDFGLAKLAGHAGSTQPGLPMGTISYMSPEQARGEPADHRSDIWALGVVLYEMLTGERPFRGETEPAVLRSILDDSPVPISASRANAPPALVEAVHRSLEKEPIRRYGSAAELLRDLQPLQTRDADTAPAPGARRRLGRRLIPAAAVLLLLVGATLVPYWQRRQEQRARALLPRIEQAALAGNYAAAYGLAERVQGYLAGDSALASWMPVISDRLTVTTRPESARVYLQRFSPDAHAGLPDSTFLGTTPIRDLHIARGSYRVMIRKRGFAPLERTASSALQRVERRFSGDPVGIRIDARLLPADRVPDGMVHVPGGAYRLVGSGAPTTAEVVLEDFFIDRYEVSNAQFQRFIQAGGYANPAYWKHPFVVDGRELTWDQAVRRLTDRTGLPGPRRWTGQQYPPGQADHPVTHITWYEAAAYAEFAGKRLPTAFEWEKAARNGAYTRFEDLMMPWGLVDPTHPPQRRANFSGDGTVPVHAYAFGASPYGAYNMAGNAKEWLLNATGAGHVFTGGSWRDPMYLFSEYGSLAGFSSSPTLGFRCARTLTADADAADHANLAEGDDVRDTEVADEVDDAGAGANASAGDGDAAGARATDADHADARRAYALANEGEANDGGATASVDDANAGRAAAADQGGMRIDFDRRTPVYHPVDDATFRSFLSHYQYDDRPLRAAIVDTEATSDWIRETIRYAGADNDRVLAYLYLPKRAAAPFQTLVFVPGSGAFFEMSVPEHVELLLAPHIKAGRAVLAVVLKGMIGRAWDHERVFPEPSSVRFRELMVLHSTELSRGIDYLETREDIDTERLAYVGVSWGSGSRLVFAAVENRYQSVVLVGGGIDERLQPTRPEASNINFAPRIEAPTLLLNGRYDEEHPYYTRALPLWNLLREPKELVIVDGGHIPPAESRVPVINDWLDRTMGPVRR